jgi:hypothetical protein
MHTRPLAPRRTDALRASGLPGSSPTGSRIGVPTVSSAIGRERLGAGCYLVLLLASFVYSTASAQTGAAAVTQQLPDPSSSPAEDASAPDEPSSSEQGQATIEDLFSVPDRATRDRELRRKALTDTQFYSELRTFYMDSNNLNGTQNEAWALGGSAGFKTGYFRELFAFGATAYTSQRLQGPADKGGTTLLTDDQAGYSVIGEAYAQFVLTPDVTASVGLRGFDTPFLSQYDTRMTPNTFEGATVQGSYGGDAGAPSLRFGAGYIDKIKERDADSFVSMATAAGAHAGVSRGVSAAGATYVDGDLTIGTAQYYSADIMNIFYMAIKDTFVLTPKLHLGVGAQYTAQHSVGDNLLLGHTFATGQFGLKTELSYAGVLLTTAFTRTRGDGTTVQSPWSANPGYTTVQVENFDRSGEDALLFRAAYNFPMLKNLSAYALYVHGSCPDVADQYAQNELDMNLQWKVLSGTFRGLKLLARYGHVSQQGPTELHTDQLRLVIYYDLPLPSAASSAARSADDDRDEAPQKLTAAH